MKKGMSLNTMEFATQAVHGGMKRDATTGAVSPGIVTSATFAAPFGAIGFSAAGTDQAIAPFVYAREGHPNSRQLEERLTLLDCGEAGLAFASGMAAISGLLLHRLDPGDHLVMSDISYAGTAEFARGFLSRKGVRVSLVDLSDLNQTQKAVCQETKLVYAETPCNPILKLVDIEGTAEVAHSVGAELAVDSTFATAFVQKPLQLGADWVVHSLTKYYGGHGDSLGGIVIGRAGAIKKLEEDVGVHLGAAISPFNAWLIMRGIETLPVRMPAYSKAAAQVADFLKQHSLVTSVRYPGLSSHPQHNLAKRQMSLMGGMISFKVKDSYAFGESINEFKIFSYAASLGLSRSLILYCDTEELQRSTFKLDSERLSNYRAWAEDGFFRLSIGLESADDLCLDLAQVLEKCAS